VPGFQGVQDGPLRDGTVDGEGHLAVDATEDAQVGRQHDAHGV
jgi:hypothetical protein